MTGEPARVEPGADIGGVHERADVEPVGAEVVVGPRGDPIGRRRDDRRLAEAVGGTAERGGRAVEDRGSAPVDIPHGDAHAGDLDEQRRVGCDHAEPAGFERRAEWRFQDDGATVWRHCTGLDQAAHARRAYREVARVGMWNLPLAGERRRRRGLPSNTTNE